MKNKYANTSGNTQKGGVNPVCNSLRPSEPPKGIGSPTYCGYPIKLLGPFSRYLLGIEQESRGQSELTFVHRRSACAECRHATFMQGFDSDGLPVSLVACAGGGYKPISPDHDKCPTNCHNWSDT